MLLPILYNYKPYPHPRKGLFRVDAGFYDLYNGGWQDEIVERTIIGEADNMYVERLYHSTHSDIDLTNYGEEYLCPTGLHITRLVKWLPTQTQLFI